MTNEQRPNVTGNSPVAPSGFTSTRGSRPSSATRPSRSPSRPAITDSPDLDLETARRVIYETPRDRWALGVVVVLASMLAGFYGYFLVSMFWFGEAFERVFWPLGLPPFPAPWPLP